ncbi:DgyrCDS460 [Dimorphilus gyrociliatus]|uniref:DgyrCDS460 n=1 Tax=Dimorphilus gyrociliatus TaxID=2664684 RepID=A0A7I8V6G2_9ANNE|nr:DgyrCDS460 [Dimorphilus gyrociliatus]
MATFNQEYDGTCSSGSPFEICELKSINDEKENKPICERKMNFTDLSNINNKKTSAIPNQKTETFTDQDQLRSYFEKLKDRIDKLQQNESKHSRQISTSITSINEISFLNEQIRRQKNEYKNLKVQNILSESKVRELAKEAEEIKREMKEHHIEEPCLLKKVNESNKNSIDLTEEYLTLKKKTNEMERELERERSIREKKDLYIYELTGINIGLEKKLSKLRREITVFKERNNGLSHELDISRKSNDDLSEENKILQEMIKSYERERSKGETIGDQS